MPIRFRRTMKIAPGVKVNFSKSGISTTVGPKGFHFTFGKRGIRRTVSIPGTGISEVDYIKKNESAAETEEKRSEQQAAKRTNRTTHAAPVPVTGQATAAPMASTGSTGVRSFFILLAVIVFFVAGAAVLGLIPGDLLSNAAAYFSHMLQSAR